MPSHRIFRINENIKQILSEIIIKEIEDPRIKNNIVTITKVDTDKDLKNAKVFFICLSEDKKDEVLKGLKSAKGTIFSYLKKSLTIKYVPNLTFHYDKTLIETNKVLTNIRNLNINENTNKKD